MLRIAVDTKEIVGIIDKNIYGHFAEHLGRCIYEGIWVGEDSSIPNERGIRIDVLNALKNLDIPVLRWPGGCFADEYHWMDGIGPMEKRKPMINTHWGQVFENNHFGTHEFMLLCEMLGCEPYITGNVGSGTVAEMQQWIEYITFNGDSPMTEIREANGRDKPWKLKFFGIGNENWGCGGNMRPEYYADLYRQYQTYVKNYKDNSIYRIACGPLSDNYEWMETLLEKAAKFIDGISLHYYTHAGKKKHRLSSSTDFDEREWFEILRNTLFMGELIENHSKIMYKYDPDKRIGLIVDEWGTWYKPEKGTNPGFLYQQNTLRDAVAAAINLNIFNTRCDRVKMANIAQTVNVLQAMLLTSRELMILTPTYYVFEMYKVHHDAQLLKSVIEAGKYSYSDETICKISMSASKEKNGNVNITLCNLNPGENEKLDFDIDGMGDFRISGTLLTADKMNSHNTFEEPDAVLPKGFRNFYKTQNGFFTVIPAMSVLKLTLHGF